MTMMAEASAVPIVLYRHMLRACRDLTRAGPMRIRSSVFDSEVQWMSQRHPQYRLLAPASSSWNERVPSVQARLLARFPYLTTNFSPASDSAGITRAELTALIRSEFDAHRTPADAAEAGEALDRMFLAYRELQEQQELAQLSSSVVTKGVRVDATSGFLGCDKHGTHLFQVRDATRRGPRRLGRSERGRAWPPGRCLSPPRPPRAPARVRARVRAPTPCRLSPQYRIAVTNESADATVQVNGRQWVIKNADGSVETTVPRGSPGVVGQKPVLHPGQCFEYASGTSLRMARGEIHGSLQMVKIEHGRLGATFDAVVGRFVCDANAAAGAARRGANDDDD